MGDIATILYIDESWLNFLSGSYSFKNTLCLVRKPSKRSIAINHSKILPDEEEGLSIFKTGI